MPAISAIASNARHEGRYDIDVDGEFLATVSAETIARLRLSLGSELGPERIEEISGDAAALATLDRAMNLLAFRSRSTSELRLALRRRGEPPALIESTIERLTSGGYLNDAEFARQFARSKIASSGFAAWRLRAELARRGIARDVADAAISEAETEAEPDGGTVLERIAKKKLASLSGLDPQVRRRRLYAFLARRGYSAEDVRHALQKILGESL